MALCSSGHLSLLNPATYKEISPWPTSRWRRTNLHTQGVCTSMIPWLSLEAPHLQGFLGLLKQTSKRNRLLTGNMEKQPQKPQVLSFILFSRCLERSGKSCVTQGKGSNSQESLLHLMENSAAACPSQFPSDPMSHSKQSWAILLTDA